MQRCCLATHLTPPGFRLHHFNMRAVQSLRFGIRTHYSSAYVLKMCPDLGPIATLNAFIALTSSGFVTKF
jgi:hypothetical protein